VAERVARNVAELRAERGLSVRQLAARLGEVVGHSLAPSAVSKIENGERRVDADDLVALAVALGVTPNRLLLDRKASDRHPVQLTPRLAFSQNDAWWWATGERQLPRRQPHSLEYYEAEVDFIRTNRPHDPIGDQTTGEVMELSRAGHLKGLWKGYVDARDAGLSHPTARNFIDMVESVYRVVASDEARQTRTTTREDG
jgi:transcriptional regulator with XRE-family HTH domain